MVVFPERCGWEREVFEGCAAWTTSFKVNGVRCQKEFCDLCQCTGNLEEVCKREAAKIPQWCGKGGKRKEEEDDDEDEDEDEDDDEDDDEEEEEEEAIKDLLRDLGPEVDSSSSSHQEDEFEQQPTPDQSVPGIDIPALTKRTKKALVQQEEPGCMFCLAATKALSFFGPGIPIHAHELAFPASWAAGCAGLAVLAKKLFPNATGVFMRCTTIGMAAEDDFSKIFKMQMAPFPFWTCAHPAPCVPVTVAHTKAWFAQRMIPVCKEYCLNQLKKLFGGGGG